MLVSLKLNKMGAEVSAHFDWNDFY